MPRLPHSSSTSRGARCLLASALLLAAGLPLHARVVINEIFYHAPNDLDDVQWIELHNTEAAPVDIGGWSFTAGIEVRFAASTPIPAGGFFVLCRSKETFKRFYKSEPDAEFQGRLKQKGERLELRNAKGEVVDAVKFGDREPWPTSPDGFTASLERIHPESASDDPYNWASSTLAPSPVRPAGTPGRRNSAFAATLPPAIVRLRTTPADPSPEDTITVTAELRASDTVSKVTLVAQDARSGFVGNETPLLMKAAGSNVFTAVLPARKKEGILRLRAVAEGAKGSRRVYPGPNEPAPAVSLYVHAPVKPAKIAQAVILQCTTGPKVSNERNFNRSWNSPEQPPSPVQGSTAFVWFGTNSAPPQVFDFVTVAERTAGWKVHLHKHRALEAMTTLNFTFEPVDRFVVAEPIAYDLHRRAGVPAGHTEFVRLTFDDRPLGYHLLIEQPNKAFIRRQGRGDGGNLYKVQWFGNGLVQQHEKKTRVREGHADLVALVNQLNRTQGAAQWSVIRTNFNVEEVLTYFAVSSLTAYWDGFFNNHFVYHDPKSGRWEIYPWDLDKACGYHDGFGNGNGIFAELPLSYGAAGDAPPGWQGPPPRDFFQGGSVWWRPGGYFSKPILANEVAKKLYYARIRELLDTEFSQARMGAAIDGLRDQLLDEVAVRARLRGEDPARAQRRFDAHLQLLRDFVKRRRDYLLAQKEIAQAGKFDRSLLK